MQPDGDRPSCRRDRVIDEIGDRARERVAEGPHALDQRGGIRRTSSDLTSCGRAFDVTRFGPSLRECPLPHRWPRPACGNFETRCEIRRPRAVYKPRSNRDTIGPEIFIASSGANETSDESLVVIVTSSNLSTNRHGSTAQPEKTKKRRPGRGCQQ